MFDYLSKTFIRFIRIKPSHFLEQFHKKTPNTEQKTKPEKEPEQTIQEIDIPEMDTFVSETDIILSESNKLQINTDLFNDNHEENESESINNSPLSSVDSIPACCIPAYKEPINQNRKFSLYGDPSTFRINDYVYESNDIHIYESNTYEPNSTNNSPFSSVDSFPFYPNLNKINEDDENSDPTELQNEKLKLHLPILSIAHKDSDNE
jgi:hypothetical protein